MEAIQLEVGTGLIPYVTQDGSYPKSNFVKKIHQIRFKIENCFNYRVPPIRICDNSNLPLRGFRIYIFEKIMANDCLSELEGITELASHLETQIWSYAHYNLPRENEILTT